MSDFDKFFAEKLDEEGQFPRREKNWRVLSKRLDAFGAGLQEHGAAARMYLRYWQATAAVAVVATSLLTWKMVAVQSENAELRREVAVLQEKNTAAAPPAAPSPKEQRQHLEEENNTAVLPAEAGQNEKFTSPPQVFEAGEKKVADEKKAKFGKTKDEGTATVPQLKEQTGLSNSVVGEEKTLSGNSSSTPDAAAVQTTNLANVGNADAVADSANFQKSSIPAPPSTAQFENPAALDSFQKMVAAPPANTFQNALLPLPDTLAKPVVAQKIIEPVREKSRFRVGVQVVVGRAQPPEKGVSLLTGQGVTAEFNVFRQFWLTASADWLRFDVSTDKFCQRFHPGHKPPLPPNMGPPPPPPPHEDLVKVESSQRRQQFGLGLRYQLPVRFWVRPSVSIAHTWVRVSPELVSFKFDDHGPGGPPHPPKYIVRKSDAQSLSNLWRFSAGLEHETPRWVFGLWADYSKNLGAADATFDALLLRAGVQYQFN